MTAGRLRLRGFGPRALLAVLLVVASASDAAAERELTIGMYAPSVQFGGSANSAAYVTQLAKAIESATGIPTKGMSFLRFEDLRRARPDFAIVDGVCLSVQSLGTVRALAVIGGKTSQRWALMSSARSFQALQGKSLAYLRRSCRDRDFLQHGMLGSEVSLGFFGSLIAKPTLEGAVATVQSYRKAEAVFAPIDHVRGLNTIYVAGDVPTPGLVQLDRRLPGGVVEKVVGAVRSSRAGEISGWQAASRDGFKEFARRMRRRSKQPRLARPVAERLPQGDFVALPAVEFEHADITHHARTE